MWKKNKGLEQPSCVLICGNTDILDYDSIKLISGYYNVVVSGDGSRRDYNSKIVSRKIHVYSDSITDDNFRKIMYSYSPDTVWYFSGYADGGDGLENEQKKIEALLKLCNDNDIQKLVYISSINSLNFSVHTREDGTTFKNYITQKAFLCNQLEEFVKYSAESISLKTIIVRVPYVFKKLNKDNYLGAVFKQLSKKGVVSFDYQKDQIVDFVSSHNLAELLVSITEETADREDTYVMLPGNTHAYKELGDILKTCEAGSEAVYNETNYYDVVVNRKKEEERLRRNYGFVANQDPFELLTQAYDAYTNTRTNHTGHFRKIRDFLSGYSDIATKIGETIILFLLVQYLLRFTTDSVYFRYVDLRLFYVLIIGSMHGLLFGIIAGVLECASLAFAYKSIGVSGMMLFYNPDYWLPFAILLIAGAITGHMVSAEKQKIRFANEEVNSLQAKYVFLNDVYMSVIDNKDEYKRQILGYQDSFGKIFEAVEDLNSENPADIFINGITTLERILDNHSIAIYSMDDEQKYFRLVACSREMTDKLSKSLSVDECREMYDIVRSRDTYKNTEFENDLPVYAYAALDNNNVRLMVCVYEATPEQYGLYYMNLFTILCHLIRFSFMHAIEYQDSIEEERVFKGTEVMKPEYFETELESQKKMAEAGMASYVLLKLDTKDSSDADSKLRGMIRLSDTLGVDEDGVNYLLLTQTNKKIVDIIGYRLNLQGIGYEIAEGV